MEVTINQEIQRLRVRQGNEYRLAATFECCVFIIEIGY